MYVCMYNSKGRETKVDHYKYRKAQLHYFDLLYNKSTAQATFIDI